MDGLIAAHLLKQRTKMDFKTYFQFKAPNKHLPTELKQVEELRQFMVLNGMDESMIAKQYFSTKNVNSTNSAAEIMEDYSLANASKEVLQKKTTGDNTMAGSLDEATSMMDNAYVSEMAGKTIKDFKDRARGNVMPRVAKRITTEE